MKRLARRQFDPNRIKPGDDAEPIVALSLLLELPHCLRIDDVAFLVSDRGGTPCGPRPHEGRPGSGTEHPGRQRRLMREGGGGLESDAGPDSPQAARQNPLARRRADNSRNATTH